MTPTIRRQVAPMSTTNRRLRGVAWGFSESVKTSVLISQDRARFDLVACQEFRPFQSFPPFQLQLLDEKAAVAAGDFKPLPAGLQNRAGSSGAAGYPDPVHLEGLSVQQRVGA